MPLIREKVLYCESNWQQFRPDGSLLLGSAGEIGLAQFKQGTWDSFNKTRFKENHDQYLDIKNWEDQIDMFNWAFDNNLQNHWTCYRLCIENSTWCILPNGSEKS